MKSGKKRKRDVIMDSKPPGDWYIIGSQKKIQDPLIGHPAMKGPMVIVKCNKQKKKRHNINIKVITDHEIQRLFYQRRWTTKRWSW